MSLENIHTYTTYDSTWNHWTHVCILSDEDRTATLKVEMTRSNEKASAISYIWDRKLGWVQITQLSPVSVLKDWGPHDRFKRYKEMPIHEVNNTFEPKKAELLNISLNVCEIDSIYEELEWLAPQEDDTSSPVSDHAAAPVPPLPVG